MSTPTEQLVAEAGLPPEHAADLEAVVSALRELVPDEAPAPSPALAALMAAPPPPPPPDHAAGSSPWARPRRCCPR